jgi:hypothetical protein
MRLYKTIKRAVCATLFTKKITITAVDQGNLGDCYYVSSLASIAQFEPEIIQNIITEIGDNNYTVNFFDVFDEKEVEYKKLPWSKVPVTINGNLERVGNTPKYSYTEEDPNELWFPLLEKAYATWKGGYDTIGNGGYPDVALAELTGRKSFCVSTEAKYFKSAAIQKNTILGIFEKAERNNWKMVCATGGSGEVQDKNNPDVYTGHAYSYIGYNHETHMIQLRNPWGKGSSPEGFFWISVPDFLKYYDSISYIP